MDRYFSEKCRIEINKSYNCDLTPQESSVLSLAAEGWDNRSIGLKLSISEATVKSHLNSVYGKLGLSTKATNQKSPDNRVDIRVMAVVIYKDIEFSLQPSQQNDKNHANKVKLPDTLKVIEREEVKQNTEKYYVHQDLFWNPRFKPPGTELKHALALRNISIKLTPVKYSLSAFDVALCAKMIAQGWKSIGDDMAPFIHLDFLDELGKEIPISNSKEWTVADFQYHEDRPLNITKRLYTQQYPKITGVRVWFSEGYAYPSSLKEYDLVGLLVYPIMMGRAFVARLKRRLKRVFWVPKKK